jgi:hypothetical protein
MFAYVLKRSTTYGFMTPPPAFNELYHDQKRGWVMRYLQNKALAEFKDSAFEMVPDPKGHADTTFPGSGNQTECCWLCGRKHAPITFPDRCDCSNYHHHTLLHDKWLRVLSFVHPDHNGCVVVEFNAQQGLLLTCCSTKVELYDLIDGAYEVHDPVLLSDFRELVPDARYGVEAFLGFGDRWKRTEYQRLGRKVYAVLHKMLRMLEEGGESRKRPRTEL